MPELPEVETIVRGLDRELRGETIDSLEIFRSDPIIQGDPESFSEFLCGRKIKAVQRRAKFLLFHFEPVGGMVVHLRMTGKFTLTETKEPPGPHERIWFRLKSGRLLIYSDLRCFGTLECHESLDAWEDSKKLGPEPFSQDFNAKSLRKRLRESHREVKPLLLDQGLLAGLGNIYASEVLFRCGINPCRKGKRVKLREWEKLVDETRSVLNEAIEKNGTSISDFRRVDEKTGEFQNFLRVYEREGKPCVSCGMPVQRIVQQQRSSYFCSGCQV